MNFLICDDIEQDRRDLCTHLHRYGKKTSEPVYIHEFSDSSGLIAYLDLHPDFKGILFLDIYLKNENGLEAASAIREKFPLLFLVFITVSTDHALDAFEVQADGYLVKPLSFQPLFQIIEKYRSLTRPSEKYLELVCSRRLCRIPLSKIYYIETVRRKVLIHTSAGILETYTTLAELEERLEKNGFLRCRRTHIINMAHILYDTKEYFELDDHTKIPLSIRNQANIRQRYYSWIWEQAK